MKYVLFFFSIFISDFPPGPLTFRVTQFRHQERLFLGTLVRDPRRGSVTLATPYPLVSAPPREDAGNGENVRAGVAGQRAVGINDPTWGGQIRSVDVDSWLQC